MATKTIADIDVTGRTVLMRVDFNVPIQGGWITNDRRIKQALPSIERILATGAKLVLMSHRGRPAGTGFEADYSLCPVANRLGSLIKKPVLLGPPDIVGPELENIVSAMESGDVVLMENLRFHSGETMPDKAKDNPDKKLTDKQQQVHDDFVAAIAELGEVYVNDAFGTCHREHASMYGVAQAIQAKGGPAVAGFLVEKEIHYLSEALVDPKRPFLAILGGSKVSDKIKLIANLLEKVDCILVGGAMAYTLLVAEGTSIGKSHVEEDQVDPMQERLETAGNKIQLPCDHVASDRFSAEPLEAGPANEVDDMDIPEGLIGLDIGASTIDAYLQAISRAGTIIWNGPMGVFELPDYASGTEAIAAAIAEATRKGAISIVGGGDSAVVVEQLNLDDEMTHVSTGGGASLKYLGGEPMPPIEILDQKPAATSP